MFRFLSREFLHFFVFALGYSQWATFHLTPPFFFILDRLLTTFGGMSKIITDQLIQKKMTITTPLLLHVVLILHNLAIISTLN